MNLTFREIAHDSADYWAAVELRESLLRRPLGLQFSPEQLQAEKDFCHLACYCDERLVACIILIPQEGGDVQMRQVAVAADLQGQGVGAAIVGHAEAIARARGFRRMILHARETAVGFYEKVGYSRVGEPFEAVTIPHWSMEKSLVERNKS